MTGGDLALARKVATGRGQQSEGHTGDGVNHRDEAVAVLAGTHGLVSVRARFLGDTVGFPLLGVVRLNDGNARNEVLKHGVDITGGFALFSVFSLDSGGKPVHGGDDEENRREQHGGEFPRHQHEDEESGGEGDDDSNDGRR